MHFWGECYGRTSAELEALVEKSHKRHKCVGNQKYTHCDVDEHEHCTGADYAEAVYKFKASSEESRPLFLCSFICTFNAFIKSSANMQLRPIHIFYRFYFITR